MMMEAESTKNIPDEMWNTNVETWKERLPEPVTEILKQQKSMQMTQLASPSDTPVSLYSPESLAQNLKSMMPKLEQTEAELQKFFKKYFPKRDPMIAGKKPSVVFAEGLGEMEHKANGDMIFLDTAELKAKDSEKVVETMLHERTHQMMEFYLADQLGQMPHKWMSEGFANIMPEILRAQREGLDYQSYAQEIRDVSGLGEDVSNGMSLIEAVSQREKVDKYGLWNYEYGQAFVKSFVARHGLKEYFRLYQEMGKNPEKYEKMGAISSAQEAMKEMGYSENEFERTMDTTSATLELRGKMNMNAYRNFLKMPEENMLRSLEKHDIRVLLTLPHETTPKSMTTRIEMIEDVLQERYYGDKNMQKKIGLFINSLHNLNQ